MKVGDKVFVRKPADIDEGPSWISEMDKYDGTIQEVSEVCRFALYLESSEYTFSKKWVTPVIESGGQYYKIADKHDVGKNVIASNHLEIEDMIKAHKCLCFGELVRINDIGLPFQVREPGDTISESWRWAVIEVSKVDNYTYEFSGFYEGTFLCETEEEAYALLSYWDSLGCLWVGGKKPLEFKMGLVSKYSGLPYTEYSCENGFIRHNSIIRTGAGKFSDVKGAAELMKIYPLKTTENYLKQGIWCDTLEEKHALLSYLSDKGYKWRDGQNIHDFDWKRFPTLMKVKYEGTGLTHEDQRKDSPFFSTLPKYSEIMRKYGPAAADNPATPYQKTEETPLTGDETCVKYQNKVCYDGIDCWAKGGGQTIQYDPSKFSYISDEKSSESEKKMTKPSMFVVNTLIRPSESCPLPLIVNYLASKGYTDSEGSPLGYSGNLICIKRDKKAAILTITSRSGRYISEFAEYEEIITRKVISPAAEAAKPQKESKMALFSLASKKVRGLAYGALNWAFISPLKRTFKPVATIAQFSVCYLTLAAAGYFAYGLYQNPQSVVEWISEISPVEIRLKNSEE